MRIVLPMISMRISRYVKDVAVPIIKVLLVAPILPLCLCAVMRQSVGTFFIICSASVVSFCLAAYFIGCTRHEQEVMKSYAYSKIARLKR